MCFSWTNSSISFCQTGSGINRSIFIHKLELNISPFHCIQSFFLFCLVTVWSMAVSLANYSDILIKYSFYHHLCLATSLLKYFGKLNTCLVCKTVFVNQGMLPHPTCLCCLILFTLLFLRQKHEALHIQSLQLIAWHNYKWPETQSLVYGLPCWCSSLKWMNSIYMIVMDPSNK